MDCPFCDILDGSAEATMVYRDDQVSAFLDIQPVNPGHLIVVPNRHATYLADLDPEAGAQIFRVAQKLAQAIRESELPCEGINFYLSDGTAAHQEVYHVHLHVIPRVAGDGHALRFSRQYEQFPPRSELEQAGRQIQKHLTPQKTGG
jgi:histidine triad (HIT) family protein